VRTVFLGTSEFAAAVLRAMAHSSHRPALVVSRPDSRRGRGRLRSPPPVALAARELGIELEQPASVNDEAARARISQSRPDALCVCAFGALLRPPLLAQHTILNVHPSLLPRWRGAAPIERAIMHGDSSTGVSIMRVTAGLDSGPVCLQGTEAIEAADTYGQLAARLQAIGARLLVRALDCSPPFSEQDESLASYAEKISAADRELDPARPAGELERVVRALTPHVGARVRLGDGTWLGVAQARVIDDHDHTPGSVSLQASTAPVLRCARGSLQLSVVQPPGGRQMSGEDYVRGHLS